MAKKPNLAKFKKSDLTKGRLIFLEQIFLSLKPKKLLYTYKKLLIKISILHFFELKRHIHIETNAFLFIIDVVLSQLTSDQSFSDYVTNKLPSLFQPNIEIE